MSAIVTSEDGEDWFTNSYGWHTICELAMERLAPAVRDEYQRYASSIGVDFSTLDQPKRAEVAGWLLAVVDELRGARAAEFGWDTERDRAHLSKLSDLLRPMS
ncbi:hypothetical protein ACIHEI_29790 [Kitasatospora sp. NPDC051984]|uniref:hypothetical protein n=1 Tax=Kitasatospora sp. NPDC051984 TaxID=3364059 RepID=UPI0037C564EF